MNKRVISLGLVVLIVVLAFAGCGASSETSAMALKFYNAIKNGDADTMLKCLDPETAEMITEQLDAAGMELDDLFDISAMMGEEGIDAKSISFKVVDEEVKEDTATVTVEVSYKANGEDFKEETDLPLVKVDGKWYVSFGY